MIRRSPIRAAVAATVALVLSGCATFDNNDAVADVDGTTIDDDRLAGHLIEFTDRVELFQSTPIDDGRATGDDTRTLVGALIRQQLFLSFVDDYGIEVDEIRQSFIDTTLASSPVADTSIELQRLIADLESQVQVGAVTEVPAPDIDELRALYAGQPASTGLMCMRHILLETEADAERVLDDLADGADFAELAAERSIDPTAVDSGGALTDGATECIPLQTVLQSFDPAFTVGALASREGVASQPVESSFGWHVILHRPWDEVADSVGEYHQPGQSGQLLYEGYRATADVDVAPRYGTWDPVSGGVIPLG